MKGQNNLPGLSAKTVFWRSSGGETVQRRRKNQTPVVVRSLLGGAMRMRKILQRTTAASGTPKMPAGFSLPNCQICSYTSRTVVQKYQDSKCKC